MIKQLAKDALGWGFLLWLVGYAIGIMLFTIVPTSIIGWIIMPVGIGLTLWVLFKRVNANWFQYYILLGIFWVLIAVICDYYFLVKAFNPEDGYYKLDVYLYYFLTLALPLLVGWKKTVINNS